MPHRQAALGGVVLAGGRGRRFGGPKAGVAVGGSTLVERAVELLRPLCADVVVASRAGVQLPPLDVRVVLDDGEPSALTGLRSGLRALATDNVVVLACDLLVAPSLVERLLEAPGDAAAVADEHGGQPLCARYPGAAALEACEHLLEEGDPRARRLLDLLDATPVTARPGELRNLNTWLDAFAAALDLPPLTEREVEQILDLTRVVAHGTERANGPVASFLVGLAAGRRGIEVGDALREAGEALPGLLPPRPSD